MSSTSHSTQAIFKALKNTLNGYLEAQYHIWDESLIRERKELIERSGATYADPYYEATPAYVSTKGFDDIADIPSSVRKTLIDCVNAKDSPIFPRPFTHQAKAIQLFVGPVKNELIVATGTGSGKTESFLLPLIASLAQESQNNPKTAKTPAVRALLLYPMNALVNDQLTRLRKLLGHAEVSKILSEGRGRPIRFGMYTSRTPYPGEKKKPAKSNFDKLEAKFSHFKKVTPKVKADLEKAGMWPAKDMSAFEAREFVTSPDDVELVTRHEMQEAPPDLLITNYSMLEYMLVRPVEREIFSKTKSWLQSDVDAKFTVILDEAHMYRGAAGAEVGLLLRRLQSRLGIDRSRIRFILTSASLGEGPKAEAAVKRFAAELTGLEPGMPAFELIKGDSDYPPNDAVGTESQATALASFNRELLELGDLEGKEAELILELNRLASGIGMSKVTGSEIKDVRSSLFDALWTLPIAGKLSRLIMGSPRRFSDICKSLFADSSEAVEATESMMAICNFAQRADDGRVFLPIRMHLFFRGLGGVYACTNSKCEYRLDKSESTKLLGRLYDEGQRKCKCGARVFEVLTHRDCGAAYLKVFVRGIGGEFCWHEQGHREGREALTEMHLLVQSPSTVPEGASQCWMHTQTGTLIGTKPPNAPEGLYLKVYRPLRPIPVENREVVSFDGECPVCEQTWRSGTTKIMDLVTKGDAPFAHLIKAQVQNQPKLKKEDNKFPNGGRKNLLFSDGRQKAARLARDVPREVEKDVFRQLIICAAHELLKDGYQECKTNEHLYTAFVHVLNKTNVVLFDGKDRKKILEAIRKYRESGFKSPREAIDDSFKPKQPHRYQAEILRQLGNRYYSLATLTLAYIRPAKSSLARIAKELPQVGNAVEAVTCVWLHHALASMAFDPHIPYTVRGIADGRRRKKGDWGLRPYDGAKKKKATLDRRLRGIALAFDRDVALKIDEVLLKELCETEEDALFISPDKLVIVPALNSLWYRCDKCTWLTPLPLNKKCPECGHDKITEHKPEDSHYLRARKQFWRDPVERIVNGLDRPFVVNVQEHTAQLGYLDEDDATSTTEDYERCFKDILTSDDDEPIDVLSSTTTMEVGIDIGSLIAVALRNVPPMRQNYQQRAGRAGRRGSSVSTVVTFAQNGAHDSYYFKSPAEIIGGKPPLPGVDVGNPRIVERHVHAALVQAFFHERMQEASPSGDLFAALGRIHTFYSEDSKFSLLAFKQWLDGKSGIECLKEIGKWVPTKAALVPKSVAQEFVEALAKSNPGGKEGTDGKFLDYLFSLGLLPTYAFPRALCALEIEKPSPLGQGIVEQRPQQALNVALSEYSPGRIVVVNKKAYQIGSVTSSARITERAAPLFEDARKTSFIHCQNCGYTEMPDGPNSSGRCPFCEAHDLSAIEVIQPEVVYPKDGREVDEFDDDPVYSQATSAQYPVPRGPDPFVWRSLGVKAKFVAASNQTLIMVNKGIEEDGGFSGFNVCKKCGKAPPPGELLDAPHTRDYQIPKFLNPAPHCDGEARNVYLGFQFRTDVLLIRIPIEKPLFQGVTDLHRREALESALLSMTEAITLSAAHILDIDPRELGGGIRFIKQKESAVADLFLHDTASGGAGYAHMAGQRIEEILTESARLLRECDCSSSCRDCLRHYGNRMIHARLDRFLASELIEFVQSGSVPTIGSVDSQRAALSGIEDLLELAGFEVSHSKSVPLVVKKAGKSLNIGVHPSIVDGALCGHELLGQGMVINDYELAHNLPGVFSEIDQELR